MADSVKIQGGDGNQESNIQKSHRESRAGFFVRDTSTRSIFV
ncbi:MULTISPECIES: hypothetical protein [Nostoc]|nr:MULTISPECIES: hypothetical protein [Nostoc]